MKGLNINESFICKIWEGGERFYSNTYTSAGEPVRVLDYGRRNFDAGPDYKDAKIKIGNKIYMGDIEIHKEFRNWFEHGHKSDSKYNSVILQVVLWDSPSKINPKLRKKRDLSTVILSQFLNRSIHLIWQEIIDNPDKKLKLPCSEVNHKITDETVVTFLNQLALERLNLKASRMKERLIEIETGITGRNTSMSNLNKQLVWEQMLYEFTFEALGYSKNKEPMMKLAKNLSLKRIRKILDSGTDDPLMAVRSLIYGAGGMLFDLRLRNKYANKLKDQWNEFKDKMKIELVSKAEWQFFRLRPQNFPSVRLAFGSDLILKILNESLFRRVILEFDNKEFKVRKAYLNLLSLFKLNIDKSSEGGYVGDYLSFLDREGNLKYKYIGKERITDIIVNVISPLVYLYSKVFDKILLKENVFSLYNSLKIRTDNSVLNVIESQLLKNRKIRINSPAMEQASIQLYNFYCMRERCLECKIGQKVFANSGYEYKIIFY